MIVCDPCGWEMEGGTGTCDGLERQKLAAYESLRREASQEPAIRRERPGRNDPCWCGSGKKYKRCHLLDDEAALD